MLLRESVIGWQVNLHKRENYLLLTIVNKYLKSPYSLRKGAAINNSDGALVWEQLSSRQKDLLEIIYQADVEIKARERYLGEMVCHENVARWLFYGNDASNRFSRLKLLTIRAGFTEIAAEDIFNALSKYRLIEQLGEFPELGLRLTTLGYRTVQLDSAELKLGEYTVGKCLDESAWRALVLVCQQWQQSLAADALGARYAGAALKTWSILAHQHMPLVKIHREWVQATAFAHLLYAQQYRQYQNEYPHVAAPAPRFTEADILQRLEQAGDWATLARIKRGNKGLGRAAARIGGGVDAKALYQFEKGRQLTVIQRDHILAWIKGKPHTQPYIIPK